MRLSWQVDGMTYRDYLGLTAVERNSIHMELLEILDSPKPDDGDDGEDTPPAPRRQKRLLRR